MPFLSKAQRRKFYALKNKGEMDQKTIDEWEKDTPSNIPERKKTAMINSSIFWNGFQKRAVENYAVVNSATTAPGVPDKVVKLNELGGVDPRTPEEMQVAQAAGLVTLSHEVIGASCGTCMHFHGSIDETEPGTCLNPEVGLDVSHNMLCAHWENPSSLRASEPSEMAAPDPMAQMMPGQEPAAPQPNTQTAPQPQTEQAPTRAPAPQATPEAGVGSTPAAKSSPVGTVSGFPEGATNGSNPLTEQITSDFQGQDASAAPTSPQQSESAPKQDKPKKEKKDSKSHTINIHVGGEKTAGYNPWVGIVEGY
jgi:hypothetical protein